MNKNLRSKEKQVVSLNSILTDREIQEEILGRCKQAALSMGMALLEEEVAGLCGPAFSRKGEGLSYRGGSDQSSIIIQGAKYRIKRPRVRNSDGEVVLESLAKLQSQDLLDEKMHQTMLAGVSSRNYEKVIEGYSEKLGVKKSSVSRAFVRASQKDLDAINDGSLSDERFIGIVIDSYELYGRAMVMALGINQDLKKVPLGLKEGNSENSEVVKDLLESIKDRGFTPACEYFLALIDGSKALKKAIKAVFGERVLIQRCWIHKLRNLKKYVPDKLHGTLHWRMKKIMNLTSFEDAAKEIQSLAHWLAEISQGAVESLAEAGDEILTMHLLGITGELRKSLASTNMIEGLIEKIRSKMYRIRRGRSSPTQALRWSAAAVRAQQKSFLRLRGAHTQGSKLIAALNNFKLEKIAA